MNKILYNDMEFLLDRADNGWTVTRRLPDGTAAVVAAGLFRGLPELSVRPRAQALVRSIFPSGVKLVGPDVAHPVTVGDIRIVGPNVTHPNFIYWTKDSTSFAR
jgi:hypothetical protein